MSREYIAAAMSDEAIRKQAKKTLTFYRPRLAFPINIVAILMNSPTVPTVKGDKKLRYVIVPDHELDDYAVTEFTDDERIITVRKSVHEAARFGDGRSRLTLAHELGHAVLHTGAPKARGAVLQKTKFIKPYESAERQATVFGAAFLIDDARAAQLASPGEISVEFCVSHEAATICFDRLHEHARRQVIAHKLRDLSAEIAAHNKRKADTPNYLETQCPTCGNKTLLALGVKFLCTNCGTVSDSFQDGDPYP
jgi:Zn-dependent peptidase ImmA (M78 family)